jgi:hypothetical protein
MFKHDPKAHMSSIVMYFDNFMSMGMPFYKHVCLVVFQVGFITFPWVVLSSWSNLSLSKQSLQITSMWDRKNDVFWLYGSS